MGFAAPVLAPAQFSSQAQAQAIGRIIVEGNQRIEPETVISYMQIAPGDPYSAEKIDESIKILFQTGLFSDVRISRRGNDLVVFVEENPMINRVNFEGNDQIKDKDLAKEVELKERTMFTRAKVQSDVQRIVALYRRSGYHSVRVDPKIIRLPQARVDLIFEIHEGQETGVASINFVGNEAFSDGDLRSQITTTESAWWRFFSKADNYDPDRLNYDKELLRRFYLKNGFADFQVISADAELDPDGENFIITFTVEEGPLYRINSVSVAQGDTTLDPTSLQRAVESNPGEDYDASKIDKTVENITVEAGKGGYAFAKVEPDIKRDPANQKLDIVYNITEGPRAYIERIDIIGNTRTQDEVIRRELRLFEGDAYNRVLVERGRRRLTSLDFFEKIDFREEQGSAPDKVVLIVEVVEKSTGSLNLSAGYSSSEGIIGSIGVTERNLLGRGQTVRLNTSLSFKRQSIDFGFTEPYFLGMPMSAGFDIFATRSDESDTTSYTSERIGFAIRNGFRLDENQSLNFKYSLARRRIDIDNDFDNPIFCTPGTALPIGCDPELDSDDLPAPAIYDAKGVSWKSAIGVTYIYDDLDNSIKPTKGFRGRTDFEIAGLGGDVYFASAQASAWYFMPLMFDGFIMKFEGNVGHMESLNGDDVPIQDRFFKGGDTFRGFYKAGVGPRMDNAFGDSDAIGGQTYAIGTVEVNFPLGLPEEFGVSGAVFTDFGTVFNAPESTVNEGTGNCFTNPDGVNEKCTVEDTMAFRASVGAGIVWESPFGPLRFDLAYPFLKADYDKTEWFRFSIGTRF